MPTQTKTAKTTKKLRKAIIMENILAGTFNRPKLIQQFHCSDRAFRNDMNELATQLEEPIENQVTLLRAICAERLSNLAGKNKLDPNIMAKIIVAGFSKKVELKEEITESKTVTYNLNYSDEDKSAILDAYRRLNKNNSGTPEPISIH